MIIEDPFYKWLASLTVQERGTHGTLYAGACYGRERGWNKAETCAWLKELAEYSDRRVPDREIYGAWDDSGRAINGEAPGERWPRPDLGFRVEALRLYAVDRATLRKDIPHITAAEALAHLYRPTDLVCVGRTATDFETRPLDTLREPESFEFINPSPMSRLFGVTRDGRASAHTRSNTGPRVYAVVEFDSGECHEHAILLRGILNTRLPLVMMVYSGSVPPLGSVHGWFKASHVGEDTIKDFYNIAITLGADPKMHSPCQFTRLPGGRHNGTGRKQTILDIRPHHAYHKGHELLPSNVSLGPDP